MSSATGEPLGVAVVGCGYWGPNLVRNFRTLPDCNLEMMCDISAQRLEHLRGLYPEVKGEMDFAHMLNGGQPVALSAGRFAQQHE